MTRAGIDSADELPPLSLEIIELGGHRAEVGDPCKRP